MENDKTTELLNEIGNVLAQDTDYPLDGTVLYVEAESMMVDISIFKDLGESLVYRWPMKDLSGTLLELWESAPDDQKWTTMLYRIVGGKFDAAFSYDPLDQSQYAMDRRERLLRESYGNKRIIYPSLESAN